MLQRLGYDLVLLRKAPNSGKNHLQGFVDGANYTILLDECMKLHHILQPIMDVEVPQHNGWRLEISSPGLTRPLVRSRDFERHLNRRIDLELVVPHQGRKRFQGTLIAATDHAIDLRDDQTIAPDAPSDPIVTTFTLANIAAANLCFDEAQMRRVLNASSQQNPSRKRKKKSDSVKTITPEYS